MQQDPFFFYYLKYPLNLKHHISILAVYWKGVIIDLIKLAA